MGVRLSVKLEGADEWYGDDHKLYFYEEYEDIKNSFGILYPYILKQWEDETEFFKYLQESYPEDAQKEIYDFLCCWQTTPELIITASDFKLFAERYLEELKNPNMKKADTVIEAATGYLTKLSNQPGNKILEWG